MRVIQDISKYPAEPIERLFVQVWYSMVHKNSLDSHRVRCMDTVNSLREVQSLMQKTHIPNIQKDVKRSVDEAVSIAEQDAILRKHFSWHMDRTMPLLRKIKEKDRGFGR